MEIVYYPDMYLRSERLLKQLLLCWGTIKTIAPPTQKAYFDAYLAGKITSDRDLSIEGYKEILDHAGEKVIDFLEIKAEERRKASENMRELLTKWNADTQFYESLKIRSISDLVGKEVEWYWFFHEKLEQPLVKLMLQEHLVVNWDKGEIVGLQEIGKSYISVIAAEVQRNRNVRLITDDEFYLAAKGPAIFESQRSGEQDEGYELVSLAIPQVFLDEHVLEQLSWKDVFAIRRDLLPLSEHFYAEVESCQRKINGLAAENRSNEAFDEFCEFCERVATSFRPLAKEVGKLLRSADPQTLGMINGILLPAIKLALNNSDLGKVCDIAALASTAGAYAVAGPRQRIGFEYLENLGRALSIARMKKTVTSLIPKALSKKF